jgi:hypothetical protein
VKVEVGDGVNARTKGGGAQMETGREKQKSASRRERRGDKRGDQVGGPGLQQFTIPGRSFPTVLRAGSLPSPATPGTVPPRSCFNGPR